MERNVKYIWIGAVFFIILIFMVVFIMWLNRVELDSGKYEQYYAYSTSEVDGVGINTPIRYKGISVGRVVNVSFKDIREGIIQVQMLIDSALVLQENSSVVIAQQGLAGANYLSLIQGYGEILQKNEEGRKVLNISKGGLENIINKVSTVGDEAQHLLKNINRAINEENTQTLNASLKDIRDTIQNLKSISQQIDARIKNDEYNMREILLPTLLQLQGSLQDMSKFFRDASYFLDKVDKNPYDSFFGKEAKNIESKN